MFTPVICPAFFFSAPPSPRFEQWPRKHDTKRYKEIRNSRARHEYFVEDTLECGIILTGTEVKSLRAGQGADQRRVRPL
jgi:hypothetical protein